MKKKKVHEYDQVVYCLQGGGALGAYQVGVCEGLLQHGYAPNWLIGTSIGAINASIIAGNKPEYRIKKLHEFWDLVSAQVPFFPIPFDSSLLEISNNLYIAQYIAFNGIPGFFKPRTYNPWLIHSGTPDELSYYDTSALHDTLNSVIDFDLINQKKVRLTLGAVHVNSGKDIRFDNFHQDIGPEHIMASAALPPGFPAVKIKEDYYWDGGVSSNTPFSIILEEKNPQRLLCFIVNLFSFPKKLPTTMMEVLMSKKEFEYASRHKEILSSFLELHMLQHTINLLPKPKKASLEFNSYLKKVTSLGHPTSLNILRFHYTDQPTDLISSDFNFASPVIKQHWQSGQNDVNRALTQPKLFEGKVNKTGATLHEF